MVVRPTGVIAGYTFVVRQKKWAEEHWRFVYLDYDHRLNLADTPNMIFDSITDDMLDLWKRIAVDNVVTWRDSNIDTSSLRLVRIETIVRNATEELFGHDAHMFEQKRFAALSKLTPEEAKLLGIDSAYALMKLFSKAKDRKADNDLIDRVRDASLETELFQIGKALQ